MEALPHQFYTPALKERVARQLNTNLIRELAAECGFGLAGVAAAIPDTGFARYRSWVDRGLAGEMRYLSDHRAEVRSDPRNLLPGVRSILCLGMLYNGPEAYSTRFGDTDRAWISRYAWGEDYHVVLLARLEKLAALLSEHAEFAWRACVDTAPLLERSYANRAGLGWIGKNTCLINQQQGSWFFLGELLTTLDLPPDFPPPDRCGTCTRCIDACPTTAIVPSPAGGFELDARLCISYFTIELRGAVPDSQRVAVGSNVFGCDICQDVCPWNSPGRAALTEEPGFAPRQFAPSLELLAALSVEEFRQMFRNSPINRAKYSGFLRNVALAMGNTRMAKFREPLQRLANSSDTIVAEHARWAMAQLE